MNSIIEHGGIDLSLYQVTRERMETDYLYENRFQTMERQKYMDLLFFNQILDAIHLSVDEDDLRHNMRVTFEVRERKNLYQYKRDFSYGFGMFMGNDNMDKIDYMEFWQSDNPNRVIYVEL